MAPFVKGVVEGPLYSGATCVLFGFQATHAIVGVEVLPVFARMVAGSIRKSKVEKTHAGFGSRLHGRELELGANSGTPRCEP